ncbi:MULTISPECIES: hypothetical protein [Kocuria]|jgi:hypothetical protein|nr:MULTISPECIES: hypothetical protein [Kocuria]NVC25569.1 hypothetical protein [Kocuria salina]THE18953.1 hypothetical protein E1J17_03430 [Kocuria rosea]
MTTMPRTRSPRGGRPSKGERQKVSANLPIDRYNQFWDIVESRGTTANDLAVEIITDWLDRTAMSSTKPEQQTINLEERRIA